MKSVVQGHRMIMEPRRSRYSQSARTNMANALCGVLDYAVQPFGMLLAAPFLLHRLGASQYGLWILALAVIAGTSLVSVGMGESTLRYVALCRGQASRHEVARVIRGALTINLILGGLMALLLASASPFIADHAFVIEPGSRATAVTVLRLGGVILLVRSLEIVLINSLRAYERYGLAMRVSAMARTLTVVAAVVSAGFGYGVAGIIGATLAINIGSVAALAVSVSAIAGPMSFLPYLSRTSATEMAQFGGLLWLQTLAGIAFSHADRLFIGSLLGTVALAHYTICVQGTQPIHGLLAAALHFLFPHLSARFALSTTRVHAILVPIITANVVLAAGLCLPLVLFSKPLLTLWMGPDFAGSTSMIFAIAAIGFGLLGLNVSGHYALLALGEVRYVTGINLIAGVATLIAMAVLIPRYGVIGAALGRLVYGPITWLMYYRLHALLSDRNDSRSEPLTIQLLSQELEP